jgi:hypothetical protein
MKRYSLIISLVLILSLSGVASAQVIMPPLEDAGGVAKIYLTAYGTTSLGLYTSNYVPATYPRTTVDPLPPMVGYTTYNTSIYLTTYSNSYSVNVFANLQAAFEFNLTAVNTTGFTSKDFTAKLNGLNVDSSSFYYGTGTMNVDLFDMGDAAENGVIDVNDYNSTRGSRIARLPHVYGSTYADFDNIDVTCAVRNDLFGTGAGDYSGFILKSPDSQYELVQYDDDDAILTINVGNPGPKCGGGGGGGGGGCFIANAAR